MFGAAAMSLSSFCVVTNALRLNLFKLYDASHDRPRRKHKHVDAAKVAAAPVVTKDAAKISAAPADGSEAPKADDAPAALTLSVEGMMCGHCEMTVKKALEALPFVAQASASHETATATVRLSGAFDDAAAKAAVEKAGYAYHGSVEERDHADAPKADAEVPTAPAELTLSVEGMMCGHCEATVKKALEALPFVAQATASHETATATVRLSAPADESALRTAIESEGYAYRGITQQ